MKENWINKLIKLLNEYRTEKGERNLNESEVSQTLDSLNYLRLFIKRLVKNDKIKKSYKEWMPAITKNWFLLEWNTVLIILCSIQDNPIEFLCSVLK